eukprot:jgi/Tetstr1/429522/TSEL_019427.t1
MEIEPHSRAEKTPQAYESIADLRDCVRRNEMLPLNPADSDAALGRDVGAGGGAWKGSSSSNSIAVVKEDSARVAWNASCAA